MIIQKYQIGSNVFRHQVTMISSYSELAQGNAQIYLQRMKLMEELLEKQNRLLELL